MVIKKYMFKYIESSLDQMINQDIMYLSTAISRFG